MRKWGGVVCVMVATGMPGLMQSDVLGVTSSELDQSAVVNQLNANGTLSNWLIVGEFGNNRSGTDNLGKDGLHTDFLESIGGERQAVIRQGSSITCKGLPAVEPVSLTTTNGIVDFHLVFPSAANTVAYAFSFIESSREQMVHFYLGADDRPKVWVNGELALENLEGTGRMKARRDHFSVRLKQGLNRVLVKVDQGSGEWKFMIEAFDEEHASQPELEQRRAEELKRFQGCELGPKALEYILTPGRFPEIGWKQPGEVEAIAGKLPLTVRWFDNDFTEVETPAQPGRYLAYIEGDIPGGGKLRRSLTFYCRPSEWNPWKQNINARVEYPQACPVSRNVWGEYQEYINGIAARQFAKFFLMEEHGAIVLSYLSEAKPVGRRAEYFQAPWREHEEAHLALKRKLLNAEEKYTEFALPREGKRSGPVLRKGTLKEAGMSKAGVARIGAACNAWYRDAKEPFVALVARRGVIVYHEAFGPRVKKDTPLALASITKILTGMMFAQFMNQGLVCLDDPVGAHLPDFPVEGDEVLTLRHCLTHTSGLEGHTSWNGIFNPWLDNVIATGVSSLKPGREFLYNGNGMNLTGKVMEFASGKSIPRLLEENFFGPLGAKSFVVNDLASLTLCNAEDLAKVAQLLLNKGVYGNKEFFSEKTYSKLLPRKLSEFYPGIEEEYGLGLSWMRARHPNEGKGDIPAGKTLLSRNTIGHGSAAGSVFRVDLDNELVVIVVRNQNGINYDAHLTDFLKAVDESLIR